MKNKGAPLPWLHAEITFPDFLHALEFMQLQIDSFLGELKSQRKGDFLFVLWAPKKPIEFLLQQL